MAVDYFCRSKVDRAVFEVGLGGRFDATNILNNIQVSTICNVELDHMHLLGDTREKIAFEKAGIIKPGIPVVTACDGGPLEVIRKQAASLQSPVVALKFSLAKGDPYRHFSATTFGASSGFAEQIQGCVGWIKEEVLAISITRKTLSSSIIFADWPAPTRKAMSYWLFSHCSLARAISVSLLTRDQNLMARA